MTTKQYRKTERLAVECEYFDILINPLRHTNRYGWQEILDSYRVARDLGVSTPEFKRFHKHLRLIIAYWYRNDDLVDKLAYELAYELEEISEQEIRIAESLDKEIETNE